MRIIQIILFSALFLSCSETSDAQNQSDWKEQYRIVNGTGALGGKLVGEVDDGLSFSLHSLIDPNFIKYLNLASNNEFLVINIHPGYYRIIQKGRGIFTLLDSIPIKQDSITVLIPLSVLPDFEIGPIPPVGPIKVQPSEFNIIRKSWNFIPISQIK